MYISILTTKYKNTTYEHTKKNIFPLFQRRDDLTFQKRFLIAYIVLFQYSWGTITRLSSKYNVSRPFIYENVKLFSEFLETDKPKTICQSKEEATRFMISARLEGKCSIPSISKLMKRQDTTYNSVGSISQTLKAIGAKIGNSLNIDHVSGFTFSICSDEIFSKQTPILITLDPISLLILRIELSNDRKKDSWVSHFQAIKSQGISFSQFTSDEGPGMLGAKDVELPEVNRQSDSFHAVAHRLGLFSNRFYQTACKAIGEEYRLMELANKAKTEKTRNKYLEQYSQAKQESKKAIELYDNFVFIYHCLLDCFQSFDKYGKLKDVVKVKSDFDAAIDCLKELNIKSLEKEITSIENCKSDLFTFYKTAKEIIDALSQAIDNGTLRLLCLAWQTDKNSIKSKDTKRTNKLVRREKYLLNDVKKLTGNEYETIKKIVYEKLDNIVQSSAAVECINSLLRFYLNSSKNQVTQEFLNLFMFYHNHRRFTSGKRKGQTPMEIATESNNQADWLELLLQKTG